jgi:hypothetical protein
MVTQIVNAAPMVIDLGVQDLSTRQLPREPDAIPQHCPKFWLFTQKGPSNPQLLVGNNRDMVYGTDSFDLRGKFANHSTVFANLVNAEGNACMYQRVIPADAGPEANLTLWLDVLPCQINDFDRNVDGSIKLDMLGAPIVIGQINGFKLKYVVTHSNNLNNFGQQVVGVGDQVDPITLTQSQRYPILELKSSYQGEYYNNVGIRLSAPTIKTTSAMPQRMMDNNKAYPFFLSVIKKATNNLSTVKVTPTIFGEQKVMFTLKQNVIDPVTDQQIYLGDRFPSAYRNIDDLRYPLEYGDIGGVVIYNGYIEALLTQLHNAEIPYIDSFSDFTSDPADKFLYNILTGESSQGVPYHTVIFVDAVNSVAITENTNIFLAGSSDGTIDDATHAALVEADVVRYLDPNDELMDLAVNVESIIYDTGFPISTKKALISFISQRKDTFVVLSTHDVNDNVLTASQEFALAISLRSRLQFYPESDYFGTPVMRGMVLGRCGKLRNSQFTKYLPLSAEVAIKSARYMGASNGRWKSGYHFDGAPGSIIDNMYGINVTWVPSAVRNRNWDVGLNFVLNYDRRSLFFPALKTVYADDTSVLNSYFTAMAICYLNKAAHAAWREFSGVANLTNAQLVNRVNEFIYARTKDRFDNRFVIVPDATITELDEIRGFSWTLPIRIYSPSMKTVMTTSVQAFRMTDLGRETT